MIRVAQAQINPTVGDLKGNLKKILSYIEKSKAKKADVVVFPELVITGYPPEDLLHKDHFVKDNIRALKQIAPVVKGIVAIVGFVDQDKNGIYNAAALIENKKVKKVYHKKRLPNYGVFDEQRYFKPGKSGAGLITINKVKCAVNICEDIWQDKGPFKGQARKGAKILFNISSSPYDYTKLKQREQLLSKRARQTKTHIFYTNIVGGQDELVFDGGSLAVDPAGKVIASSAQFSEELLLTDIHQGPISVTRAYGREITTSTKAKKLSQIASIYNALVLGTKDYVQKNGFSKVLIGLSGGIDSALVAAIAVDAIGRENVVGVSMPSKYSSKGTQNDAKRLAENLGIEFKEIPIGSLVIAFDKILQPHFKGQKPNVAEENIQARVRGNLLMSLSNKFGWLVLTTGNKSEMAVGYCTLYGDMCGGFAVIKDVPKTKVYKLCEYRNAQGKTIIPVSILKRPPSAELRANQKDQDSLPDYDTLDNLLAGYVEKHHSFTRMAQKGRKGQAKQTIGLVDRSEYKRRQAPPGVKITPRAFGRDWRLPITNKYREF